MKVKVLARLGRRALPLEEALGPISFQLSTFQLSDLIIPKKREMAVSKLAARLGRKALPLEAISGPISFPVEGSNALLSNKAYTSVQECDISKKIDMDEYLNIFFKKIFTNLKRRAPTLISRMLYHQMFNLNLIPKHIILTAHS